MAFHVRIEFFGIFGVVPDSAPPKKLMLLVPSTDCNESLCTPAPDAKPRYRHRWFINFDPRQVVDAPLLPTKLRALWNLYGHQKFRRITFAPTFETPRPTDLDPQKALAHVVDISQFASKYAHVPRSALTMTPGPEIAGQILIQHGQLVRSQATRQWWFPGTLEKEHTQDLHHGIDLRLTGLTGFVIHSKSSTGKPDVPLKLTAPDGQWVKLEICNLCDRNPLRWETEDDPRVDEDFRWYFELSEKKADLGEDLKGRPLPVPHPLTTQKVTEQENRYDIRAALGHNCFSAQFQPQTF
jgi:hypothetical protein